MACNTCDNPEYWAKFKMNLNETLDNKFSEYDEKTAKVRDNLIHNTFASHKNEINVLNSKVTDINNKLESLNGIEKFADVKTINSEQKAIRDTINIQKDRLNTFEQSRENFIKYQMLQNSVREQRDRDWACRVTNFQQPWSRENITEYIIFRNLIRPTLEDAAKRGQLEYIPTHFNDVVERSHMLPFSKGQIPTFIFRFTSRCYLDAWMNNKKAILDRYNSDIKRFNAKNNVSPVPFYPNRFVQVKQDMTDLNRKTMTFVYATNLVSRAKVAGQHVQFQLKSGSRWIRVQNPFGKNLQEMSQPIPGSQDLFLLDTPPILQFSRLPPAERSTFFSDLEELTEQDFQLPYQHPSTTTAPPPPSSSTSAPSINDPVAFPPIIVIDEGNATRDTTATAATTTTSAATAATTVNVSDLNPAAAAATATASTAVATAATTATANVSTPDSAAATAATAATDTAATSSATQPTRAVIIDQSPTLEDSIATRAKTKETKEPKDAKPKRNVSKPVISK